MASFQPAKGGLRWVKSEGASNSSPPIVIEVVATNYGTAIFKGDPVKKVNDGTWDLSGATGVIDGVCDGVESYYEASSGTTRTGVFLPANTVYTGGSSKSNKLASLIRIIPSRGQIFEMDVGAGVADAATAQGHCHGNATMTATAGSTVNGRSGYVINASSFATTATHNVRIVSIPMYGNSNPAMNDVTAANWKVNVKANLSSDTADGSTTGT
jgi:hypothetical protein